MRPTKRGQLALTLVAVIAGWGVAGSTWAQHDALGDVVQNAFAHTHQGWSSDEVLLRDDLYRAFTAACQHQQPQATPQACAWKLLTLRKSGRLTAVTSQRSPAADHEPYRHVAEMAARHLEDKYQANMDRVICDPNLRGEFDRFARRLAPAVDAYLVRKAAFGLRKARKLRPELITRVADWDRQISVWPLVQLRGDLGQVPERPGVYIFRDPGGYLYIGESSNLRRRLATHLNDADASSLVRLWAADERVQLAAVEVELHSFDPASRAAESRVRRAYESQLIDSRQPRFNVRP